MKKFKANISYLAFIFHIAHIIFQICILFLSNSNPKEEFLGVFF